MAQIIINNGRVIEGNNISINNGTIIVDGKNVECSDKKIDIQVIGEVENLTVDHCNSIDIKGLVGKVQSGSGDVSITGNVTEDAKTGSGDLTVGGDINGNVNTGSGDVECNGNIKGNVKTGSGDINYKR